MRVLLALFLVFLAGCSGGGGDDCTGVLCGACPQAVALTVHLGGTATGDVTASGVAGVACSASAAGAYSCGASSLAPGSYSLTLAAPGHEPQTISFTLAPPAAGCCACSGSFSSEVTLAGTVDSDAGSGTDGGVPSDAGDLDGGALSCDPAAITFVPSGGSLIEGQLCDDVFVCVDGEAAAMAVASASARFVCSATPEGPCSGWNCAYRDPGGPSMLDAAELAEICKVTVLDPRPVMTCMIYI